MLACALAERLGPILRSSIVLPPNFNQEYIDTSAEPRLNI